MAELRLSLQAGQGRLQPAGGALLLLPLLRHFLETQSWRPRCVPGTAVVLGQAAGPDEQTCNRPFPFSLPPADRGAARRAVGAGLWQHRGAEEHVAAHRRGAGGAGSVSRRRSTKNPGAGCTPGVLAATPLPPFSPRISQSPGAVSPSSSPPAPYTAFDFRQQKAFLTAACKDPTAVSLP